MFKHFSTRSKGRQYMSSELKCPQKEYVMLDFQVIINIALFPRMLWLFPALYWLCP